MSKPIIIIHYQFLTLFPFERKKGKHVLARHVQLKCNTQQAIKLAHNEVCCEQCAELEQDKQARGEGAGEGGSGARSVAEHLGISLNY